MEQRLCVGPIAPLASDSRHRPDRTTHTLLARPMEEDRRLPAAGAFIMFMFGVGCGGFWTMLLTWMF